MKFSRMPEILHEVGNIIRIAGEDILSARASSNFSVEYKAGNEVVSSVDRSCQNFLQANIGKIFSDAVFVMEESSEDEIEASIIKAVDAEYAWIIDPIDGTSNYIAGKPRFGIQVALASKGTLVAAWINCPALGKHFSGSIDQKSISGLNSADGKIDLRIGDLDVLVAVGDFDTEHKNKALSNAAACRSFQGTTSCAVDYVDLLEGNLDLLVYKRTRPWDHAPGALLTAISGGFTQRFDERSYRPFDDGKGIVAGKNPKLRQFSRIFTPDL